MPKLPAAVQAVAALQDTPASPVPVDRPGLGVAWIRQAVPFHRSASDTVMLVPPEALRPPCVLIVVAPTAVQAVSQEQAAASMEVLKGIVFVMILVFDTFYGRFGFFQPRVAVPEVRAA